MKHPRARDSRRTFDSDIAVALGVNEAIILSQIGYWLQRNREQRRNERDGRYWVYNTYEQWRDDNFPWWSVETIKRAMKRLEQAGVLLAESKYNKRSGDRTKWYTIDEDRLRELVEKGRGGLQTQEPTGQFDPCTEVNLTPALPEITTENTNIKNIKTHVADRSVRLSQGKGEIERKGLPYVKAFFNAYKEYYGEPHPWVARDRLEKYEAAMAGFESEWLPALDPDCIPNMARYFFDCLNSNDHHIAHFATPGVLRYACWKAIGH